MAKSNLEINKEYKKKYGFKVKVKSRGETEPGLSKKTVDTISDFKGEKGEHEWIHESRLKALEHFFARPMPTWGGNLGQINFDDIIYYINPEAKMKESWNDVPSEVKKTFDRLGIPEAERKFLSGVGAQFDSEVVYHKLKEKLEKQGVIFVDPDTGLQKYPHIFKRFFGTVVPPDDNKFAALNSAVFSGGSFIYIPKGVQVDMPLQAYFRINAERIGQFERTLIIADEGAKVHYIEGCLPESEEVLVGESLLPIQEIKVKAEVLNSDGEKTFVDKTMVRHYEGNLIKIRPVSPANTFYLTTEHPVLSIKRKKVAVSRRKNRKLWDADLEKLKKAQPEFIEAEKLEEGDFLVYPVNKTINDNSEITKPLLLFLGYYLAEGNTTKMNGYDAVVISLNINEKLIIEHVKSLIKGLTGKEAGEIIEREKNSVRVYVYSDELVKLCEKHSGKYADKKKISKEIMELPPKKQIYLINTYYKSDGSLYKRKSLMVRAHTVSRQLAFQMQELLARQRIFASIYERGAFNEKMKDGKIIHHKKQYTIYYSEHKSNEVVKFVNGNFLVPIRKISREMYKGPVFNFHVSNEPNTYLVKGFAVHNCTAPIYSKDSLHAAVVEIIALPGAHVRYTTLQNWSKNVFNLVTKRAHAYEGAIVEWVDANIGSKLTMKYPSVYLKGRNARADILSVAFAADGQHQDAGGKVYHLAPDTTSRITSKSVSKGGGRTTYRGLLFVAKDAMNVKSSVRCDALLLDEVSKTDTYPYNQIYNDSATITHEATVGKIGEDQLFYLMSRGLTEEQALNMVVIGFFDAFAKEIPLEYAVEFNKLIQLEMAGSVG